MYIIIFFLLLFFAGCLCGLLNTFIEAQLLKKLHKEKIVTIKPLYRTLFFGIASVVLCLSLRDLGVTVFIFTMLFISFLISMIDLKSLIIPNKLVIALLAAGIIFKIFGVPDTALINSLFGLFLGFIIMFIPYALNLGIGAGDVKLVSVIGFCVGHMGVLFTLILVGLFTLIYMTTRVITRKSNFAGSLKDMIPMGPFILLSFIIITLGQNTGYFLK